MTDRRTDGRTDRQPVEVFIVTCDLKFAITRKVLFGEIASVVALITPMPSGPEESAGRDYVKRPSNMPFKFHLQDSV